MDGPAKYGTLYVVATPIGNLEDITIRAIAVLKDVDIIAAEDTRHSKKLLRHYGIQTELISCHEHNETAKAPGMIDKLKAGNNIALISDAGTPLISDPGYTLINRVATEGIAIMPIPGCSAAIAGLSVSGLPTDSFLFLGFPPKKQAKQQLFLGRIKEQKATLIFYESPKRIKHLLNSLLEVFGDRKACLAREITKLHEEFIRGDISHILRELDQKDRVRGECSLFVEGETKEKKIDEETLKKIISERLSSTRLGTAGLAKQISKEFDLPKNRIYDLILTLSR